MRVFWNTFAALCLLLGLAVGAKHSYGAERMDLMPRVIETTDHHLSFLVCGGDTDCTTQRMASGFVPGAVYSSGIIWTSKLDMSNIHDRAKIIHEMVHHLQRLSGQDRIMCRGALERPAYAAQEAYLKANGEELDVPPMTRLWAEMVGCE